MELFTILTIEIIVFASAIIVVDLWIQRKFRDNATTFALVAMGIVYTVAHAAWLNLH